MNWLYLLAIGHLANGRPAWELGINPVPFNDKDLGYDALDRRLTANILWLLPKTVAKFPEPVRIRKVRFTTRDAHGDELEPVAGAIVHLKTAMARTKVFIQPNPNNKLKVTCRFDLNNVHLAYRFKIPKKNSSRIFKWKVGPRSHVTLEAQLDMSQPCLMHMKQDSSFNFELVQGKGGEPREFLQKYMLPILGMRLKQIIGPVKTMISNRICHDITEWNEQNKKMDKPMKKM